MESLWKQEVSFEKRPVLTGKLQTEVAVIGAGMTGILTAEKLQRAGKKVVVLEASGVGSGQTGNTTAKITSQHGLIYHTLVENLGKEKAALYARANEAAIQEYRRMIEVEEIDCDYQEASSYIYSQNPEKLRLELLAAQSLGLPASYEGQILIPVACAGAIRFQRQGQFHPLKFLEKVARDLTIYEQTPVKRVEDGVIFTSEGSVEAEKIVFACHYPFVNYPGLYFTRMYQSRSYVLALEGAAQVEGMYLGDGGHSYSFRNYKELLLLGGEGHRTGDKSSGHYEALEAKAKELFPESRPVGRWSAQDCMTADGIPYIGQYGAGKPDWYVATGFGKWGMSSAMVAAMILSDTICGKENPWAEIYNPGRFLMENFSRIAIESTQAVKGLAKRMFQVSEETARELPVGQGRIITLGGEKVGVYKDEKEELFVVDVRCPHLGCQLEWNPDEKSWDCPCHGSRFDYRGKLLNGPAQEGI